MKVKALKEFQSTFLSMAEGETIEIDLDEHTFINWIETGLIEEVKSSRKKVKANDDK